jgi:tetratricopeptide (TPR) repeat protein
MKAVASRVRQAISRAEAAAMLRAARKALAIGDDRAGETIGWTLTALRDNYHARLIKIEYLLRGGHWDSADALIARTIMHLRDHPLLRLRLARSFFEQGRIEQAATEIRRVLQARPEHAAALALAARIASAQGRYKEAAALWMQASDCRQNDETVRAAFVQSLLDAKLTCHAAAECAQLSNPPAFLAARVFRAQGRTLDAVDRLEAALMLDRANAIVMCELISAHEDAGDIVRFRQLLPRLADAPLPAQLRASEGCLTFGEFDQAIALAQRIAEDPLWRDRAEWVLHIAQLMSRENGVQAGQFDVPLSDRSRRNHSAHRASIATHWINAMLGRLTVQQIDSRAAGADPFASVLQPLMRQALRIVEAVASHQGEPPDEREAAIAHRDMLAAALGATAVRTTSHDLPVAERPFAIDDDVDKAATIRRAA